MPTENDKKNAMRKTRLGQLAVELLVLAGIVVTLIAGFVSLAASFLTISVRAQNNAQAFAIAEAGIEYYEWHLAYASNDFSDGTGGQPGPYVHNYYNKSGYEIGQFSLTIIPPPTGSTMVTITSAGTVLADSSIKKIVQVRMGIPSFAQYAWVLNAPVLFGTGAQIYGAIDSNSGIHFNGIAHNIVESALTTYVYPTNNSTTEWAVYTDGPPADPVPTTTLPAQPTIFLAGRELGVPAIDFTGIPRNPANIKSTAQASGYYLGGSSAQGYDLLLSTTTFSVYKVTQLITPSSGCINNLAQTGWGTWSIQNETLYATGTIPQNGDMFFGDNLWVRDR